MNIQLATTDAEILRCLPVLLQLRPHLVEAEFVPRIRRQFEQGYCLAFLEDSGDVQAVAGFRVLEMLSRGRHLYVDDLVTAPPQRSRGYGAALFDWLVAYAWRENCEQLELDSGVQRFDAHRFYFHRRMHIASYHFSLKFAL